MGNTRKCQHIADTVAHTDEEHDDRRGFHSLFHRCNQVLPVEFMINSTGNQRVYDGNDSCFRRCCKATKQTDQKDHGCQQGKKALFKGTPNLLDIKLRRGRARHLAADCNKVVCNHQANCYDDSRNDAGHK